MKLYIIYNQFSIDRIDRIYVDPENVRNIIRILWRVECGSFNVYCAKLLVKCDDNSNCIIWLYLSRRKSDAIWFTLNQISDEALTYITSQVYYAKSKR